MKSKYVRLFAVLLVTGIIAFAISARGCVQRSKKAKVGSSSVNYNTFAINAPSSLVATSLSLDSVSLAWFDNSNNNDGFEIERKELLSGTYLVIATVGADITAYLDSGLNSYVVYYYRVRALNTIGDRSPYSNEAGVMTRGMIIDVKTNCSYQEASSNIFMTSDGRLFTWGVNNSGQLGLNDTSNRSMPAQIGNDTDWSFFALGSGHSFAIKSDGTLWSWGADVSGQLGLGDTGIDRWTPTQIRSDWDWNIFEDVDIVSAGELHSLAKKTDGTIWGWGNNAYGQCGFGDTNAAWAPNPIGSESDWSKVYAQKFHSYGIKTNPAGGTLWLWGDSILSPTQFTTFSDWLSLATGSVNSHTMGLKTGGTLWAWGANYAGQLGLGDTSGRATPVQIGTDTGWFAASTGNTHTIAIKINASDNARTLWSWGRNDEGQLGLGDTGIDRYTPTQIGTDSDWSLIAAGADYNLAVKLNGTLWSWGYAYGLGLASGDYVRRLEPMPIGSPAAPSGLNGSCISSSEISLSWIDNSYNEEGFKIERKSSPAGTYSQIGTIGIDVTSYSDLGPFVLNNEYYYRVRAFNSLGNGSYSNVVAVIPIVKPPSSLGASVISSGQIDLSWNDNALDETGFIIERKIGVNGSWIQIATLGANLQAYSDTSSGFAPNSVFSYRIKSYNTAGESIYSNEMNISISGEWLRIATGKEHSLGLKTDSSLWAWGNNSTGQLGIGTIDITRKITPTLISSGWSDITAFSNHTIAIRTDGAIWACGDNSANQLTDNITWWTHTLTKISSDTDWEKVATGWGHTIGLKNNGSLWSCGNNEQGQLGLGDSLARSSFTRIGTNDDWLAVASGGAHSLALKTTGTLWSWGWNSYAQLGLGDTTYRNTPSQIGTESNWSSAFACGITHTLAIKTNSTLWSWGSNLFGQLGMGDTEFDNFEPFQVGSDSDWAKTAANGDNVSYTGYSIGIKANGTIWSWGANWFGQLGLGNDIDRYSPVQISFNSDWSSVTAGEFHALGRKTNGTLWAWGRNNLGQLGLGDMVNRNIPTLVESSFNLLVLTATAVSSSGIDLIWTDAVNESGFKIERSLDGTNYQQLTTINSNTTSYSDTGLNLGTTYYYRIAAYYNLGNDFYSNEDNATTSGTPSSLFVTGVASDRIDFSWADTADNELGFKIESREGGTGSYTQIATVASNVNTYSDQGLTVGVTYYYRVCAYNAIGDSPWSDELNVTTPLSFAFIFGGTDYTLALSDTGVLYGWGSNGNGKLGLGSTDSLISVPILISTQTDWATFAPGTYHTLGVKRDNLSGEIGTLWSWGGDWVGQLGLGDTGITRYTPTQVGTDSDWLAVSPTGTNLFTVSNGAYHSLAIKTNKTLWSWGGGNSFYNQGQLGLGDTNINRWTPTQVGSLSDWSIVEAGSLNSFGIKTNKTLWGWGYNNRGQLGLNDLIRRNTPALIGTDSDWTSVTVGGGYDGDYYNHTIAIKTNKTIWVWGYNDKGQLGVGDVNFRTIPTGIGTSSDWAFAAAGQSHTVAKKTNGTIWSWGANMALNYYLGGQLGLGDYSDRYTPTQIGIETNWLMIDCGAFYTIGLKTNGILWLWGQNGSYQLGFGDTFNRNIPCALNSPAPPSDLIATSISSSQIDLSWSDNSDNESGFKIERSPFTNTNYALVATVNAGITSYSDISLTAGTIYYYRIRANNIFGDSSWLGEDYAETFIGAPSTVTATMVSSSRIDFSWSDVNGETGYKIERSVSVNTNYLLLTTLGADITLYSDSVLTPDATYYYRVRAYNGVGDSDYSPEANATTPTGPPAIPVLLSVNKITSNRLDITWSDVNGETGYAVERSPDDVGYTPLSNLNADETVYSDTTVAPPNTYYYRVYSSNAWGNSSYSNVISKTVTAILPLHPLSDTPPAPTQTLDVGDITVGYKFSPAVNGTITALGRYIGTGTGNTTVTLWDDIGTKLGEVSVPNGSGWQWAPLGTPIPVSAGQFYFVTVSCPNPGTIWYDPFTFDNPTARGNINIYSCWYIMGFLDTFPNTEDNSAMYGWADIEFVAD